GYAQSYANILRSVSMMLPLSVPAPLREALGMQAHDTITDNDISRRSEEVRAQVRAIVRAKGNDPAAYTQDERAIVEFAYAMNTLAETRRHSDALKILPDQRPGADSAWFSPWTIQENSAGGPRLAAYLDSWQRMARAWHDGKPGDW